MYSCRVELPLQTPRIRKGQDDGKCSFERFRRPCGAAAVQCKLLATRAAGILFLLVISGAADVDNTISSKLRASSAAGSDVDSTGALD